jgi:hypothetical protein
VAIVPMTAPSARGPRYTPCQAGQVVSDHVKHLVMTIAAATIPAASVGAGYLDALQTVAAAMCGGWALVG